MGVAWREGVTRIARPVVGYGQSACDRADDDVGLFRPELRFVELFEAGVEPVNFASRRCLEAAGFRLRSDQPDFEGMLYYRAWRVGVDAGATLSG